MAVWKTCLILALCVLFLAALISTAEAADSGSGSGHHRQDEPSAPSEGGEESAAAAASHSKSKSGASGLQLYSAWLAVASLVGAGLQAGLYAPTSRLLSQ